MTRFAPLLLLLAAGCTTVSLQPLRVEWEQGVAERAEVLATLRKAHAAFVSRYGGLEPIAVRVTAQPVRDGVRARYWPSRALAEVWCESPESLYHELGHHLIACEGDAGCDPRHTDPRWARWNRERNTLWAVVIE